MDFVANIQQKNRYTRLTTGVLGKEEIAMEAGSGFKPHVK